MDILGIFVLAVVTAVGGGTLRSILIGDLPIPFFREYSYLVVCALATTIVYFCYSPLQKLKKPIIFFDAIGLGIFMALGVSIALQKNIAPWASLIIGVITASFGGVMRDVLSARIPLIFRSEFYATACLIGGGIYFLLQYVEVHHSWILAATIISVFTVRMLGVKYSWKLPKVRTT
jgi:uncharacterized membrane protein YeiH